MKRWAWIPVALALTVAACGGIGIPKQQPGETYEGERHQVTGIVRQSTEGCLQVEVDGRESYPVVWPASANQGDEDWVNLGWFQQDLGVGDTVRGTAVLVPAASLPRWNDEHLTYWTDALGHCVESARAEDTLVLIFDTAEALGEQ
jgi:hypothetical protein